MVPYILQRGVCVHVAAQAYLHGDSAVCDIVGKILNVSGLVRYVAVFDTIFIEYIIAVPDPVGVKFRYGVKNGLGTVSS
jgi:hypothetical protein